MGEIFDEKIKKALIQGTGDSEKLHEQVWSNIEREIRYNNTGGFKMKARRGNLLGRLGVSAALVAVTVTFFVKTQPGQAAVLKIRDIFMPEKKIVEEIEGMEEENEVPLNETENGYVIYIDEERYVMEKDSGKDRIVPIVKAENLPEVFMEIEQIKDKSPDVISSEIAESLKSQYPVMDNYGRLDNPVEAIVIRAATGFEWDDTIIRYYIMDNKAGGAFVIKQQYFMEAAEGHGARFENMLKEFSIVDAK